MLFQGNPRHWDVGILVSGLDIWGAKNGKNYYETLGLARTGTVLHLFNEAFQGFAPKIQNH